MASGYAFGGQKAQRLKGIVREKIKAGLAQLVADGAPIHEAGASLGMTRGQTARAWGNIKADLGEQAR